jgi:zinc transport system substrate-binding protein
MFISGYALGAEPPAVVVSIKPVHALVAGVMEGIAEPKLLITGGSSPHNYSLRPSEARALAKADLVVWIGPQLESFLEKPLQNLATNARHLALVEVIEGPLLEVREGGAWEGHHHDHEAEHHEHEAEHHEHEAEHHKHEAEHHDHEAEHHDHEAEHHDYEADEHAEEINPHIWLSPVLAKQIVSSTARILSDLDPAHQQRYAENSNNLQSRLDKLDSELKAKLAPVKTTPYIVFHDAYHYFEIAYGLNAVGSITVDAERSPGAKRITEIRAKIKDLQARCVFSEPQFESRLVQTVIEDTGARTGVLDPLGANLAPGENSYFVLLNNLADNLISCVR